MSRRILSRRHFLRSAAAVLAAPTIVPSLVIGRPAPSNRIALAAIGVGNFVGPAVGAASLQWVPQYANSGAIAVSGLLLLGFGALVGIWKTAR